MTQALREHGVRPDTHVTVLSDGDAGLRAIQRAAMPGSRVLRLPTGNLNR